MGGSAEEEMSHSLALILSIIALNQKIKDVKSFARFTYIPHMKPEIIEKAKQLDLGFPDKLNDSSLVDFSIETPKRTINAHILTSFNFYEQQRRVELCFIKRNSDSNLPKFKACLEFDVNGKDMLRIKEAKNDKEILYREFKGNKIQEQLKAVLKAFVEEEVDPKLVGFKQSSWLVRLVQESLK